MATWAAVAAAGAFAPACGDSSEDATECLPMLPRDCAPDPEPPTYEDIYTDILNKSCGTSGTGASCHGPESSNGLVLAGMQDAYDEVLGHAGDGRARVIEENPECSSLVQRLESNDPNFRMPRGDNKLNDRQLCAIRLWIANGAKRDED